MQKRKQLQESGARVSHLHSVKSVRIRSYSGPYFPAFGRNTERYFVRMRENTDQNNSEYGHFLRSADLIRQTQQHNLIKRHSWKDFK